METSEIKRIDREFTITAIATIIVLSGGAVFYHLFEKLSIVDSLYLSVITLTTVGYGDVTPHTDIGKLFTCVYVLIGIAILGTFANLLLKRSVAHRQLKHGAKQKDPKD